MESPDLKVFAAVARLGGMNRAAHELNTVQSNVSARIRNLEEGLGTPLFERHSQGVTPTPAGLRLLPYAERGALLLGEARRAVADDGTPRGRLNIGSLETTAAMRLSPMLAGYVRAHPQVDVVLTTGTTQELIEAVLAHRVEGAFVCGPVDHPALYAEVVFRETMTLVTAPGAGGMRALAEGGDTRIVVLRAGCSYRQQLESILTRRGIVAVRRLEFGTIDGIVGCVAAGLGVTLLPQGVIGDALRDGRVAAHRLAPAEAKVETLFIRRHDGFVSSALAAFLQHARPARAQVDAAD
jgi:DNA-binding transcriptional LysR family regulator